MKVPLMILALCTALAIVVSGCGGSSDSSGDPSETTATTKKTKPTVTVPTDIAPTKFAVKELEEGSGAEAKKGDEVTVQYVGVGYNSKKEFDSSWGKEPLTFTLGAGKVIQGWDQGLEGMKVGGRREMLIPANLAYGAEGKPPKIGPNEALIFIIDLLAVK